MIIIKIVKIHKHFYQSYTKNSSITILNFFQTNVNKNISTIVSRFAREIWSFIFLSILRTFTLISCLTPLRFHSITILLLNLTTRRQKKKQQRHYAQKSRNAV